MFNNFKELVLKQDSPEWLEARKAHITATEVAHIWAGQKSLYRTVMEKRGLIKPDDLSHVPPVQEGKYKEPLIRAEIEQKFPQLLSEDEAFLPQPCVESLDDPYFMASLDGYSKKYGWIIEIKNIYSKSVNRWNDFLENGLNAEVPKTYGYYAQVQWQLLVSKANLCLLCFHHSEEPTSVSPSNIHILKIKPDPKVQSELVDIALKVKNIMLNNKKVEPEAGDTVIIDPTDDVKDLIAQYKKTEDEFKRLSDRLTELKSTRNQVKDALTAKLLADNDSVTNELFTLTRSWREGSIDYNLLVEKGVISAEALETYRKPSVPSVRLTVK